ncbi:hypothetical protein IWQ62_003612 [Dispira parvispora]|uniref:Uncharacterized protein n=1 Tax=Dispira parvispora TaxID=1520584 RepID=A0A9W8AN57_9FUNG|nr:hypothetical protein IWQ62_003612 [Dispira parvispora]
MRKSAMRKRAGRAKSPPNPTTSKDASLDAHDALPKAPAVPPTNIKDEAFEDEKSNAQFKLFLTSLSALLIFWFMAQAYFMASAEVRTYTIPFLGIPIETSYPLLSCEFAVICLQVGIYSLYKSDFSWPYFVACAALFTFQFYLCFFTEHPLERIWWTGPALLLALDIYVGYAINVRGFRWSEVAKRERRFKSK